MPPTVKLTTEAFGRENTGVVYGWIGASHQLGASMAAFGAGAIRTELGDYRLAFLTAGVAVPRRRRVVPDDRSPRAADSGTGRGAGLVCCASTAALAPADCGLD